MKCKKCAREISLGFKFCGECGTPIDEENINIQKDETSKQKNPSKIKKIIIAALSVVVAIPIAIALVSATNVVATKENYITTSDPVAVIYNSDDNKKVTVSYPNGTKETFVGTDYRWIKGNVVDNTGVFAIINNTNGIFKRTYYRISDNKAQKISEKDSERGNDFLGAVSADGSALLWAESFRYEKGYAEGTLYLYSDEKIHLIAENMCILLPICISPDGKSVAYGNLVLNNDNVDAETLLWMDGESTLVGKNMSPLAISNNGELIYYISMDMVREPSFEYGVYSRNEEFYVKKNDEIINLCDDLTKGALALYFNADNTQLIYTIGTENAYISVNGSPKTLIDTNFQSLVLPANVKGTEETEEMNYFWNTCFYKLSVQSFADTFFMSTNGLYRILEDYSSKIIANGASSAQISQDGRSVFYQYNDAVYKIDTLDEKLQKKTVLDTDVKEFKIVLDGTALYFQNKYDELYYKLEDNKSILVSEYMDKESSFAVFHKDGSVFYIDNGNLYSAKGAEKSQRVKNIDSNSLVYVRANAHYGIYAFEEIYYTDTFFRTMFPADNETYYSFDGISFEKGKIY